MVRVLELILINFANVYSGTGKSKIHLVFDEDINMFLFMGENGSGKTSIMSSIHPFAYNNGTSNYGAVIRKGMDGRKEIKILCNAFLYEILHVYTRKKDQSLSVQSYIKKDGVELNVNGTVNTFKDIVFQELGITETFLTLLSLGNRVSGFVEFTASERKLFISKIFLELDIFAEKYKDMVAKERAKKALLSNVVSKLSKYKNVDREELQRRKKEVTEGIARYNTLQATLNQDIGAVKSKLEGYREQKAKYEELSRQILSVQYEISDIKTKHHLDDGFYLPELSDYLEQLNSSITEVSLTLERLHTKKESLVNQIDTTHLNLTTITNAISMLSEGKSLDQLRERHTIITKELTSLFEKSISEVPEIPMEKEYLLKVSIHLQELGNLCMKVTNSVDSMNLLSLCFKDYVKTKEDKLPKIEEELEEVNTEYASFAYVAKDNIRINMKDITSDCDKTCRYKAFYEGYQLAKSQRAKETEERVRELLSARESLEEKRMIYQGIRELMGYIRATKEFKDLPNEILDKKKFLLTYISTGKCGNVDILQEMITELETREQIAKLQTEQKDLTEQMKSIERSDTTRRSMEQTKENLETELSTARQSLLEIETELTTAQERYNYLQKELEQTKRDITIWEEINTKEEEHTRLLDQSKTLRESMEIVESLETKMRNYQSIKGANETKLQQLHHEKDSLISAINDIVSLEREELELRNDYDKIKMIRDALSPTKGIPVELIDYYFRVLMIDDMNQLLDSVYGGKLRLDKEGLDISDTSFTIPYKKDNTIISDISNMSDGERAMTTLAFSLVLMKISLCKDPSKDVYNIILTDEMDTSLDHVCRGKYLDLLETFRHIINANQIFAISHNNMFDNYKIGVFLTSETDVSGLSQARVTKLW